MFKYCYFSFPIIFCYTSNISDYVLSMQNIGTLANRLYLHITLLGIKNSCKILDLNLSYVCMTSIIIIRTYLKLYLQ